MQQGVTVRPRDKIAPLPAKWEGTAVLLELEISALRKKSAV
jgi:hypothetical protein